ncbi:MAG TPA: AAA family ATPase [Azospirillaceae bacterium]|nr:AAA family ATPase [Azospirillaceae bacterium]
MLTVKRLQSGTGLGVFGTFHATGEVELRRYNLIYGLNGSGKTTLSRVFSSFEKGSVCPKLPQGCQFEITLSDDTTINSRDHLDRLAKRLFVFNADYVEENFRWKDGVANPIFYIGKIQADKSKELEDAQSKLAVLLSKEKSSVTDENDYRLLFGDFKRLTAKHISESIGQRHYIATHLDGDYQRYKKMAGDLLPEETLQAVRQTLRQIEPLGKIDDQAGWSIEIGPFHETVSAVHECLAETPGGMVLADLRDHDTMLTWVSEGLKYHTDHKIDNCLFCGGELTAERMNALTRMFDSKFEKIIARAQGLSSELETLRERLKLGMIRLPSDNDINPNQKAEYRRAAKLYVESAASIIEAIDVIIGRLAEKIASPTASYSFGDMLSAPDAQRLSSLYTERRGEVLKIVSAHNAGFDAFSTQQAQAKAALKKHLLAENNDKYREMFQSLATRQMNVAQLKVDISAIKSRIEDLQTSIRLHGPAAENINNLLHSYLRHQNISIAPRGDGFEILRNGSRAQDNLSEGEKTAVTFCYFISSMTAEGRRIEDLIIVVDDPISSLDTRALNHAFSAVRVYLSKAAQLIILTHNINFMNECRKWLKPKTKEERAQPEKGIKEIKPKASMIFLNVRQDSAGNRTCVIQPLPALLSEYESEYHYLFSLVHKLHVSRDVTYDQLFLMPNAIRKVAEAFLSFKMPGAAPFASKIDFLIKECGGRLDANHVKALERFAQVESHGDNVDDFSDFPILVVEQCVDCAVALMEMIKVSDNMHFKNMEALCA